MGALIEGSIFYFEAPASGRSGSSRSRGNSSCSLLIERRHIVGWRVDDALPLADFARLESYFRCRRRARPGDPIIRAPGSGYPGTQSGGIRENCKLQVSDLSPGSLLVDFKSNSAVSAGQGAP